MKRVAIFDAYGTLFDVSAAARHLAGEPGGEEFAAIWEQVARDWRLKQLHYSWLRAICGAHTDFWSATQDSLDWALDAAGVPDPALRERLLALYWTLDAYPEVPEVLRQLKDGRFATGILSNGSPGMLDAAVESAGIGELVDAVLSVETVGVFKPARAVYDLVGSTFGVSAENVLFISSNGWDAAAAAGYGFRTVWVNRNTEPQERLPWKPDWILPNLEDVPLIAARP